MDCASTDDICHNLNQYNFSSSKLTRKMSHPVSGHVAVMQDANGVPMYDNKTLHMEVSTMKNVDKYCGWY